MFVKQDVQAEDVCRWRIQAEGLPLLEASVGEERVVRLNNRNTLRTLLVEMFPKVDGNGWQGLGEIGERVLNIGMGCCVLHVEKSEGENGFQERMVLPLWRSLHSLNLMLPKEERKAMLLRLYNEDTPLQDHSKDRFHTGGATQGIKKEPEDGARLEGEVKEEMDVKLEGEDDDLAPGGLDEGDEDEDMDEGGVKLEKEDDVPAEVSKNERVEIAH